MRATLVQAHGDVRAEIVALLLSGENVRRFSIGVEQLGVTIGGDLVVAWTRMAAALGWAAFEDISSKHASIVLAQVDATPLPADLPGGVVVVDACAAGAGRRLRSALDVGAPREEAKGERSVWRSLAHVAAALLATVGFWGQGANGGASAAQVSLHDRMWGDDRAQSAVKTPKTSAKLVALDTDIATEDAYAPSTDVDRLVRHPYDEAGAPSDAALFSALIASTTVDYSHRPYEHKPGFLPGF